ncbi:MAG: protein phosphatase 2C domain-containing protein, partial [Gemmatimonadaceae bacterium]
MADSFLQRLFGRSKRKTPPRDVPPTIELEPLRASRTPVAELRVDIGTLCDAGCVREVNEDNIRVVRPTDPSELAQRGILMVVADGMGGHNAGEIASRLAVEVVVQRYADETKDPGRSLVCAVELANRVIVDAAAADARYKGMGTTCTALLLRGRLGY